mgnify:CR=1 FL=1
MEKIIEDLVKDLTSIVEGKKLEKKRENLGDLVDIRFLRMVNFALQWTSVGYQSALRLAGMKLGKKIGTLSNKTETSLILEEIKKIFEFLKAGKVEFEIIPKETKALLRIYESSLTFGLPNVSQNLCFFEEGFIEGYFDGIISKVGTIGLVDGKSLNKVEVTEQKCVGLGNNFCEFLIKLK